MQSAGIEAQALIDVRRCPLNVVADDDDGCSGQADTVEGEGEVLAPRSIKASEWFIKYKKRNAARYKSGEEHAALFAAAQFVDSSVHQVFELKEVDAGVEILISGPLPVAFAISIGTVESHTRERMQLSTDGGTQELQTNVLVSERPAQPFGLVGLALGRLGQA